MQASENSILVVEDENIARRNLEHILKKEGYEVIAADNGAKALDLLRRRDFDLVLTDLKMEKVDGMQVLEKTRELQPYTEVIMITGYASVDSAVAAMKEGAYHYIAKPYRIDEIRQIVRQALMKRSLQLENLGTQRLAQKSTAGAFYRGPQQSDHPGVKNHSANFFLRYQCIDLRRERHRQGIGGQGDPSFESAFRKKIRGI